MSQYRNTGWRAGCTTLVLLRFPQPHTLRYNGVALAEDRATVGTDPSADPGARTEAGCRPRCPVWFTKEPKTTSGLAQCAKSSKQNLPSLFVALAWKPIVANSPTDFPEDPLI